VTSRSKLLPTPRHVRPEQTTRQKARNAARYPESERRYARNAPLARYLGISNMTLWRWKHDASLDVPAPFIINDIEHNDLDQWDNWMQAHTVPTVKRERND